MGSRIDQSACKNRRKQVSKSVSLLQHSRNNSSGSLWAIFQSSGCSITVKSAHCDTEQCAAGEELGEGLAETGTELEDDEEDVVDDKGPFTTVSICCEAEDD